MTTPVVKLQPPKNPILEDSKEVGPEASANVTEGRQFVNRGFPVVTNQVTNCFTDTASWSFYLAEALRLPQSISGTPPTGGLVQESAATALGSPDARGGTESLLSRSAIREPA